MASEDQVRANRENASHSTGPRTDAGKQSVRYNALQHGLTARAALLPGEDAGRYSLLAEMLHAHFQPEGELEELLVDQISSSLWRLRRLVQMESGLHVWLRSAEVSDQMFAVSASELREAFTEVLQDRTEAEREKALDLVNEANSAQTEDLALLGATFIRDARGPNAFLKLSRYETTIRGSFYRALAELERLQSARVANREGAHTAQHDPSQEEDEGPEGP